MGTRIRPVISEGNEYWISKERYYELKHFCLQYNDWVKIYNALSDSRFGTNLDDIKPLNHLPGNPTEKIAIAKNHYRERMDMVEKAAEFSDIDISKYILLAVTNNISCNCLISKYDMPCGKDKFYNAYRKFFWWLSKCRD